MAKWTKTSSYGDYRDPLQNHKFDDWLVFNTKTNKLVKCDKLAARIHEARWFFGKHIGSKPLTNIINISSKPNTLRAKIKKYIRDINDSENKDTSVEASN